MSYDEGLAQRVREYLQDTDIPADEKKMFGGLAFMVNGYMCVGINDTWLMARVGAPNYEDALQQSHAKEMDFTGKPLKGFVYVAEQGIESDEDLAAWVERCLTFVLSLEPK